MRTRLLSLSLASMLLLGLGACAADPAIKQGELRNRQIAAGSWRLSELRLICMGNPDGGLPGRPLTEDEASEQRRLVLELSSLAPDVWPNVPLSSPRVEEFRHICAGDPASGTPARALTAEERRELLSLTATTPLNLPSVAGSGGGTGSAGAVIWSDTGHSSGGYYSDFRDPEYDRMLWELERDRARWERHLWEQRRREIYWEHERRRREWERDRARWERDRRERERDAADDRRRAEEARRRVEEGRRRAEEERRRYDRPPVHQPQPQRPSDDDARRRQAEEQARNLQEQRRRAEEDRRRFDDDRRRGAEDAARQTDQRQRDADETARRMQEQRRQAEDEARRRADDDRRRTSEDAARQMQEQRRQAEEARRQADEDRRRQREQAPPAPRVQSGVETQIP